MLFRSIRKVHAPNGVWNANGGWEFNAVMIAAALALAENPGKCSIDRRIRGRKWGTTWAIAALIAGNLASMATISYGEKQAENH